MGIGALPRLTKVEHLERLIFFISLKDCATRYSFRHAIHERENSSNNKTVLTATQLMLRKFLKFGRFLIMLCFILGLNKLHLCQALFILLRFGLAIWALPTFPTLSHIIL